MENMFNLFHVTCRFLYLKGNLQKKEPHIIYLLSILHFVPANIIWKHKDNKNFHQSFIYNELILNAWHIQNFQRLYNIGQSLWPIIHDKILKVCRWKDFWIIDKH